MTVEKQHLVAQLAHFLQAWSARTRPVAEGDPVVLQQLDTTSPGAGLGDFFCLPGPGNLPDIGALPIAMANQDRLDTESLRNCFFPEIFRRHSDAEQLSLTVRGQGRFHLSARCVGEDGAAQELAGQVTEPGRDSTTIPLPDLGALPDNARLSARVQALSGQAELREVCWQTRAPRDSSGRLVVLLRTFGRTRDILSLFAGFRAEAARGEFGHFLTNTAFVLLDTSPDVSPDEYRAFAELEGFHTFVFKGANLGGGGNMSQVKLLLHEALRDADVAVDELLLLDDDLGISLESLRRNWAASLFRRDTTMFTLPVFRKSRPRVLWEDGSFWGRFSGDSMTGARELVQPMFLRHNLSFGGRDHLDRMARAHYPEYATFIFQSMPFELSETLGYPAAFFLRGDDIEYSLRAREKGHAVLSNPNLCSWHEPAHSYGQEYMSIAHGIIVNLCYGQPGPAALVRFFQNRALDHLQIGDACGLDLYHCVLRDLNRCDLFLEPGFADHYLGMLAHFRDLDASYEHLPDEIVEAVTGQAWATGGRAARYSFLYMGANRAPLSEEEAERPLTRVILNNPHTGLRRVYSPQDPAEMSRVVHLAGALYREIAHLADHFDQIRTHYRTRMQASATAEFWSRELERHQGAFRPLHVSADV